MFCFTDCRWCRDCTSLLIELTHDMPSPRPSPANQPAVSSSIGDDSDDNSDDDDIEEKLTTHFSRMKELFPRLEWMRSLKSLLIVKRSEEFFRFIDPLGKELISWIFCINEYRDCLPLPTSLERLWLDG